MIYRSIVKLRLNGKISISMINYDKCQLEKDGPEKEEGFPNRVRGRGKTPSCGGDGKSC